MKPRDLDSVADAYDALDGADANGGEWRASDSAATSKENGDAPEVRSITVGELLALDIKPREYVLEPWLPTQGLALVHAWRGVGKTLVGVGIGVAVASGGTFLRWRAPKARRVLYLDGELPLVVVQERFAQAVAEAGAEFDPSFLRIVTPDCQSKGMPNLAHTEGQEALETLLEGVELLIVDHISALCRGLDENEADSWERVQEWALRLRSRGITVIFLHHDGKSGEQRGTSKREDVLDTSIALKRPADYSAEQGAVFEVHYRKARGFYGDDAKPFEAKLTAEGDRPKWTMRDLDDSTLERVLDLLRDGMKPIEIAKQLGIHKSYVSRLMAKARSAGRLPQ